MFFAGAPKIALQKTVSQLLAKTSYHYYLWWKLYLKKRFYADLCGIFFAPDCSATLQAVKLLSKHLQWL
jgi:hypothetical protein